MAEMDSTDVAREAKQALRARIRNARRALSAEERVLAAEALAANLASLPELVSAELVLAYCANAEEIDPRIAVEALLAAGVRIAYPRVAGPGALDLHEIGEIAALEPGAFSLLEPGAHHPSVDPTEVDAVLVPGVVFDARGHRVGFGGGFYDRLLPRLRADCARIGLAFDVQVVDAIANEGHDEAVDLVVTPSGVWRAG